MNLLDQREKTHGYYGLQACVAQALKQALTIGPLPELPPMHRESLEMICVKMARIVCGDHNERDHWLDVMGYAELILKNIRTVPPGSSTQEPPDESFSSSGEFVYQPRSGQPR